MVGSTVYSVFRSLSPIRIALAHGRANTFRTLERLGSWGSFRSRPNSSGAHVRSKGIAADRAQCPLASLNATADAVLAYHGEAGKPRLTVGMGR